MIIRIEKVISSLPSTLIANTLYFVRIGTGFDLYLTDSTGSVAHKINNDPILKTINDMPLQGAGNIDIPTPLTVTNIVKETGMYSTTSRFSGATTITTVTNTMYCIPVALAHDITLDSVGVRVTTAVANTAVRIVIYNTGIDNKPTGVPAYESKEILTTTTGVKSINSAFQLKSGTLYWMCIWTKGAPIINISPPANCTPLFNNGTADVYYKTFSRTYSATGTPGTFPTTTTNATTGCPIIYFQVGTITK